MSETDRPDWEAEYRERVPKNQGSVPEYGPGDAWELVFNYDKDISVMDLTDAEALDFEDWLAFQLDRHYVIMDVCGQVWTEIKALEATYSNVLQRL